MLSALAPSCPRSRAPSSNRSRCFTSCQPHTTSIKTLAGLPNPSSRYVTVRATDDFNTNSPPQQQSTSAAADPAASASRCPFPHDTSASTPDHNTTGDSSSSSSRISSKPVYSWSSADLHGMKGPGWRVLPSGAAPQLPEVPGRPVTVDESNPMGDFGEFFAHGAGPFFLNRYKEFGPLFTWQMGPTKMVTLLDYTTIKSLLHADGKVVVGWNPDTMYTMLGEWLRKSLENPTQRVHNRRMAQPGFTREALAGYIDKLVDICRDKLDEWCEVGGPIDLAARGKDLSFEFSTQLLVDFDIPPERKADLRAKFDALFLGILSPPDPSPGSRFSQGIQARDEILQELQQLVVAREARMDAERASSPDHTVLHKSVFEYSIQDMKAQNNGHIDVHEAAYQGMGLIIGGNDTSGLGVSALLATLPLFPDVVDKLREEQQQVIAKHGPALTPASLDAMSYADAVVREALRIAPPAASVFRKTMVDMEICGKYVSAGTPILMNTFIAQVVTDPALNLTNLSQQDFEALEATWSDVNEALLRKEFKPDRWLHGKHKPSGLLTFSAGPHTCLGMSLFFAEAKVLLALLARDYDMSVDAEAPDVKLVIDFNAKLSQGEVQFSRRKQPVVAQA